MGLYTRMPGAHAKARFLFLWGEQRESKIGHVRVSLSMACHTLFFGACAGPTSLPSHVLAPALHLRFSKLTARMQLTCVMPRFVSTTSLQVTPWGSVCDDLIFLYCMPPICNQGAFGIEEPTNKGVGKHCARSFRSSGISIPWHVAFALLSFRS